MRVGVQDDPTVDCVGYWCDVLDWRTSISRSIAKLRDMPSVPDQRTERASTGRLCGCCRNTAPKDSTYRLDVRLCTADTNIPRA